MREKRRVREKRERERERERRGRGSDVVGDCFVLGVVQNERLSFSCEKRWSVV